MGHAVINKLKKRPPVHSAVNPHKDNKNIPAKQLLLSF
jgi:hypothetical protein